MANHKIWLNKFSPDWNFVVNKPLLTYEGKAYKAGAPFDKKDVPLRRLRQLYESRRLIEATDHDVIEAVTEPEIEVPEIPERDESAENVPSGMPEIIEGKAGWLYVEVDGERIGKTTRDRDEAEAIVLDWIEKNG